MNQTTAPSRGPPAPPPAPRPGRQGDRRGNQTTGECLDVGYGEAQHQLSLELDWLESVLLSGPDDLETCTECEGSNWAEDQDGNRQCAYCD